MSEGQRQSLLAEENWYGSDEEVSEELQSFITEFGSFTPEWFTDIKFHLLRQAGLTRESRDELCRLSIKHHLCPRCDFLYTAKKCLLWGRLFQLINPKLLDRAPPCIRNAYEKNSIKIVADYLVKANLIEPPFYKARRAPSCGALRRWGYCTPDDYCRAMERESTIAYSAARERVRRSRNLQS
ncbi:MAG: hypothetical protein ACXADO_02190 [Candidatus Thorarchaeota archaeon]|jgi:hypothetical protein